MEKQYLPLAPGQKRLKSWTLELMLPIVGRALQTAAKRDPDIKKEVDSWEDGFSIMMNVLPRGPYCTLQKTNGRLKFRGTRLTTCDVIINFKNIDCAFMVMTPQIGLHHAYAQRRLLVSGDLAKVMSFARIMNILLAHLYPRFVSRRLLKRVPPMGLRKQGIRLMILAGMPFGI